MPGGAEELVYGEQNGWSVLFGEGVTGKFTVV